MFLLKQCRAGDQEEIFAGDFSPDHRDGNEEKTRFEESHDNRGNDAGIKQENPKKKRDLSFRIIDGF